MDRLSSIVVGTDFSPCSTVAIGQALRMAAWNRAKVHITHIIDTHVVVDIENRLSTMQSATRATHATPSGELHRSRPNCGPSVSEII